MNDSTHASLDLYDTHLTRFYVENSASSDSWLPDTPDIKKVLSSYHLMRITYDSTYGTLRVSITRLVQDVHQTITFLNVLGDIDVFRDAGLPDRLISSLSRHLNIMLASLTRTTADTHSYSNYAGTSTSSGHRYPMFNSSYFRNDTMMLEKLDSVVREIAAIDVETCEIVESNEYNPNIHVNNLIGSLLLNIEINGSIATMMSDLDHMKNTRKIHRLLKNLVTDRKDEYYNHMDVSFRKLSFDRYNTKLPVVDFDGASISDNRKEYNSGTAFAAAEVATYHIMKYERLRGFSIHTIMYVELIQMFGRYAFRAVDCAEDILLEILSPEQDNLHLEAKLKTYSVLSRLLKCIASYVPVKWLRKGRYAEVKGYVRFMYPVSTQPSILTKWIANKIPSKVRRICAYESGQTHAILNGLIKEHPLKEKIFSKHAWMTYFGCLPKNEMIRELSQTNIMLLKTTNSFKYFMKFVNRLDITEADEHVVLALSNLCICFGARVFDIVPLDSSKSYIHNAGVDIVPSRAYTGKEIQWFMNSLKTMRSEHDLGHVRSKDLHKILQTYITFGISLNAPLHKVMQALSVNKYENVKSIPFALECAKHGISVYDYSSHENNYLDFKTYESLPQIIIEDGDYKFFKLDYDDPRGLFLGEYTDCCQHIEGAGSSCAWNGHHSGESAFYVVTKKDKIVAQSWAWRNGDVIVFDSVESLDDSSSKRSARMRNMFEKAANMMIGRFMIEAVQVGMCSGVFEYSKNIGRHIDSETKKVTPPRDVYSDARIKTTLAYKNTFLFKTILSACKTSVLEYSSDVDTHIDIIFDELRESLYKEIDKIRDIKKEIDEIHRVQKLAEGGVDNERAQSAHSSEYNSNDIDE